MSYLDNFTVVETSALFPQMVSEESLKEDVRYMVHAVLELGAIAGTVTVSRSEQLDSKMYKFTVLGLKLKENDDPPRIGSHL